MARKFLVNIDLNLNQLLNHVAHLLGSDPSPGTEGRIFYRTDTDRLKVDNGSAIKTVAFIDDAVGDAATLNGATAAQIRDRATHTGTQIASTISDFDTQVRTSRLDQMAAPNTNLSINSQRLISVADPQNAQDAATKAYVDALAQGIDVHPSVKAVSVANQDLNGAETIDGYSAVATDRVLLTGQTDPAENGIWLVNAGAWTRPLDWDAGADVSEGAFVFVEEGTLYEASGWVLGELTGSFGSYTVQTWSRFSGAGQITAGAGLTQTGNTLAVGAGTGITVNADDVAINTAVVVRKYAVDVGDNASTSITVTHNLGTRDVTVGVYLAASTYDEVECDILHATTNTVTLGFAVAPTTAQYRCVVHG